MDNGKHSLPRVFDGRTFFSIPNYQRSYAWEEKQIKDFYDDYMSHKSSQNYYYGTILLQEAKSGKYEFFEIVDGQQRFTTLIIFMSCLIARLSSMEHEDAKALNKQYIKNGDLYVLRLQADDNDFFSTVILDGKSVSETRTPAQKRLLAAKRFFDEKIQNCTDEQVEELLEKIYSTNVLIYIIQDSIEAAMIFETTNDRGKSLTNLEKTKSFLMYKASLCLFHPEHILAKIQSRFSEIYRDFESISLLNINVDENSILQYNYIAFEKWKTDSNAREYQRYMEAFKSAVEELTKNVDLVESEKAQSDEEDFVEEESPLSQYIDAYTYNIQQSFAAFKAIYESKYPEFMDIVSLDRTASFMPLLMKCYIFDSTTDKSKFRTVCRLCEIFSFRVFVIFDKMANKLQSKWYSLARDFEGDFKKVSYEIVQMIGSVENDETFIEALAASDFGTKYSSPEKNYFFWKYENYLRTNEQPIATPMSHEDLRQKENKKLVMTIEHIIAQSNSEEKSKVITEYLTIDIGAVEEFDAAYLNCIGNLTLDPQSANSSKGMKAVAEKNSKFFVRAPYKCQNELDLFMVDGKWTLESIQRRREKLLDFARQLWCNFDFIKKLDETEETGTVNAVGEAE